MGRCAHPPRRTRTTASARRRCFPSGTFPQVPIDDPKMYPIYATCVELGIPIFCLRGRTRAADSVRAAGSVAHRRSSCSTSPSWSSSPATAASRGRTSRSSSCSSGPTCTTRHRRSRPSTTRRRSSTTPTPVAPTKSSTPATSRWACRWSGSSREMPNVPFKDEVWPKFLYGNAARILGLEG